MKPADGSPMAAGPPAGIQQVFVSGSAAEAARVVDAGGLDQPGVDARLPGQASGAGQVMEEVGAALAGSPDASAAFQVSCNRPTGQPDGRQPAG